MWEDPEVVREFAEREPDVRLAALLEGPDALAVTRALDIGCAGGRNTVLLAQHGIDVWALDAAQAMVVETRRRLARLIGDAEAGRRVLRGRMDDLGAFPDAHFDLVLALGVFHAAENWEEWQRALREAARVTCRGGRLLLSHFTPDTDITGEGVREVAPNVFEGLPGGRSVLLPSDILQGELAAVGFAPESALETLVRASERGRRSSVTGTLIRSGATAA